MAVKYDCDVVPFKNRPIQIVVEASSKTVWLHLYDICSALKRPMMVRIREAQGLCPSSTRIVFNKTDTAGK